MPSHQTLSVYLPKGAFSALPTAHNNRCMPSAEGRSSDRTHAIAYVYKSCCCSPKQAHASCCACSGHQYQSCARVHAVGQPLLSAEQTRTISMRLHSDACTALLLQPAAWHLQQCPVVMHFACSPCAARLQPATSQETRTCAAWRCRQSMACGPQSRSARTAQSAGACTACPAARTAPGRCRV